MQIYKWNEYDWNHCVGPHGNMGKVEPQWVADECDRRGIPWYTDGWPYSSGVKVYCEDEDVWRDILNKCKSKWS